MTRHREPADMAIAILVLRTLRGWDQRAFAAAAGVSTSSICRYETGDIVPTPSTWARLLAAAGLPDLLVDSLFNWVRSARAALEGPLVSGDRLLDTLCGELSNEIAGIVRSSAALLLAGQPGSAAGPWGRAPLPPREEDRLQAPVLWGRLERLSARERRVLMEDSQEYRSWPLCELLCVESKKAAADSAELALELAELAALIAGLVPGEEAWRWRLQGYAEAHLGNARRVGSDLWGAEEAFARASRLWQAGASGDPGLLSEAQVLSLEASLRIDQCRLPEAAVLLDRALATDQGVLRTNLLIKKARLQESAGDYEAALATLGKAASPYSQPLEPRQKLMLRFNPAWNFTHLGQFRQAEALLPEVRALTAQLGNELDTLRLRWLEGRVAAGLGRTAEALAALTEVRTRFAELNIAYDAALVTLEVAVLHLEQGRTEEVKTLALEMAPIFHAQGVHREALAALRLFCEAAKKEAATVELARRLVDYLYRAQHDPELRFEG
jgi:transcriptional regulator with XRE-family HTH domain